MNATAKDQHSDEFTGGWKLFLCSMLVIALFTKTDPTSAHEYSRFGTVESIVTRGTLQLDGSSFIDTIDKVMSGGHFYSHQLPLLAAIESPVYWLLHQTGAAFNNRGRSVVTIAFTLLTNGVALAATIVIFARVLAMFAVPKRRHHVYAVLLVCGTWLLPYGIVSNNHGIAGALLAALIYLLLATRNVHISTAAAAMTGGVLGLLAGIELLPLVSFVPITVIYFLTRRLSLRGWLAFAGALAVPAIAHALLNVRITGDVIPAGFHVELFDYPGSVFDAETLTGSIKYRSLSTFGAYAWTALFAGRGFFTFAPLGLLGLAVGVIEWRWWERARGVHLVLLGGAASSFGAALLTTNNYGGVAVGFRHAAYLAPAFITLLLPWIVENAAARKRAAVLAVACVSMTLMVAVATRDPWSVLSVNNATIGRWDEYVPIVLRLVRGDLLRP